jgi:hypothetical protein
MQKYNRQPKWESREKCEALMLAVWIVKVRVVEELWACKTKSTVSRYNGPVLKLFLSGSDGGCAAEQLSSNQNISSEISYLLRISLLSSAPEIRNKLSEISYLLRISLHSSAPEIRNKLRDFALIDFVKLKTKLRGLIPRAKYTDRATAACRRS